MSEQNEAARNLYLEKVLGIKDSNKLEKDEEKKLEAALRYAHEIRFFEIKLYWQRSLYFWGFMIVISAGFLTILSSESHGKSESLCLVAFGLSLLGYFIAIAWGFLERGAKFWQQNWEKHIDLLEDEITGKLHKARLGDETIYSVSKINKGIVYAMKVFWLFACALSAYKIWLIVEKSNFSFAGFFIAVLPFILLHLFCEKNLPPFWESDDQLAEEFPQGKILYFIRGFPNLCYSEKNKNK